MLHCEDLRDVGWRTGRHPHHLRSAVQFVRVRNMYVHSTNNVCISSSGSSTSNISTRVRTMNNLNTFDWKIPHSIWILFCYVIIIIIILTLHLSTLNMENVLNLLLTAKLGQITTFKLHCSNQKRITTLSLNCRFCGKCT